MSLKITKLSKRFANKWVLKDVSVELKHGEIFGILGENGAGKSTLLQIIAGNESANGGQISLNDKELTKLSANQRGINFWQNKADTKWSGLFSSKTKLAESEKQIADLDTILQNSNSILLLDNPFTAIQQNLLDKVFTGFKNKVKEKNLIVVLTVNDDFTAFSLCDKVGVLHDGDIVQIGTPREVYENPQTVAAAKALGRHNFMTARRISFTNDRSQEFQTLTGNHRLETDKMEVRRIGAITQNVTLAIRPEHISISFGASFPEDNLLKAKITEIQYLGATTQIKLDAKGLILEALVLRLVGLNIGDECMVGMPPDRILVLKD
jgi:ABC-type Fe3+/spermidine/putrescine transport system ATPase subunit